MERQDAWADLGGTARCMGRFMSNGGVRGRRCAKRKGARTELAGSTGLISSNKALRKCFQYIKISKTGLFAVREPVAYVLIKSHTVKTIVEHPVYPVVIIICAERDFFH